MVSLILAISAITITSVGAQAVRSAHYKSARECGFEFDYPGDWVVESIAKEQVFETILSTFRFVR